MLTPGLTFPYNGLTYRVEYVNECRAHCRSLSRVERQIAGKTVLMPAGGTLDIAPSTDPALLALLNPVQREGSVVQPAAALSRSDREEQRQVKLTSHTPINPLKALRR